MNDNAEAVSVPETKIPTGQYKQVEKVVGYTDEIFEPSVEGFTEVNYDQYLKMSGNASDGKEYRGIIMRESQKNMFMYHH